MNWYDKANLRYCSGGEVLVIDVRLNLSYSRIVDVIFVELE